MFIFVSAYLFIYSVRKILDTPSYLHNVQLRIFSMAVVPHV